jgi:hypothetical protein
MFNIATFISIRLAWFVVLSMFARRNYDSKDHSEGRKGEYSFHNYSFFSFQSADALPHNAQSIKNYTFRSQ